MSLQSRLTEPNLKMSMIINLRVCNILSDMYVEDPYFHMYVFGIFRKISIGSIPTSVITMLNTFAVLFEMKMIPYRRISQVHDNAEIIGLNGQRSSAFQTRMLLLVCRDTWW